MAKQMKSIKNQEVLEGFQVLDEITRSDFVTLYRAQRDGDDKKLVLKLFSESLSVRGAFREQFFKHVEAQAKNTHDHILPVLSYGKLKNRYYVIQEALPSLSRVLAETTGTLSLPDSLFIVKSVAAALAHATHSGIIHGNLCPNNIFFRPDGNIVVGDFGHRLAINLSVPTADEKITTQRALYLCPESVLRTPLTTQSDLYSLGIIFYVLLTGQAPFNAKHPHSILAKHANADLPPLPRDLCKYQEILDRLVAKDPRNRYPSPLWLFNALSGNRTPTTTSSSTAPAASTSENTVARDQTAPTSAEAHENTRGFKLPLQKQKFIAAGALASAVALGSFMFMFGDNNSPTVAPQPDLASSPTHARHPASDLASEPTTITSTASKDLPDAPVIQASTISDAKALLKRAEAQWLRKNFFMPAEDNVYHTYQQLKQLQGSSTEAESLLSQLREHVLNEAKYHADQAQWQKAIETLDIALAHMQNDMILFSTKAAMKAAWSAKEKEQLQQDTLIAHAKEQINQGKLLAPRDDNAYHSITLALALDANNEEAKTVLNELNTVLAEQAKALLVSKHYEASFKRAAEGLEINPEHVELSRIAAEAQAALAQQEVDYHTLKVAIEQHLALKQFTYPESDNAYDTYRNYLQKYPHDERAKLGQRQIINAIVASGEAEFSADNLEAAMVWVKQALAIAPKHTDALALESRIRNHEITRENAAAQARQRAARRAKAKQRQQEQQDTNNSSTVANMPEPSGKAIDTPSNKSMTAPKLSSAPAEPQVTPPPENTKKIRFFGTF